LSERRRDRVPTCPCQHGLLNSLLQIDCRLPFGFRFVRPFQRMLHLVEVELGARYSDCRYEHDTGDLFVLRRRQHCDRAAFAVAASEKPFARILADSSFGREIVTRRAATDAMSSRTTSSPCAAIVSRRRWPVSSPQTSASTGAPADDILTPVRRATISRSVVWICSVDESPTSIVNTAAPPYAGMVDPGAAVLSRCARASNGPQKGLGSRAASR